MNRKKLRSPSTPYRRAAKNRETGSREKYVPSGFFYGLFVPWSCFFGQQKWVSNWIPTCTFLRCAQQLPKAHQRRSDDFSHFYLTVFKPNGLLYVCSFQSDKVKAKQLFCLIRNRIDHLDGAFKPSERAITGHID